MQKMQQNVFGFLNNCIELVAVNSPYFDKNTLYQQSTC